MLQTNTHSDFAESKSIKHLRLKDAQGPYLITEEGKRYLDLTSGWCVGNLGWRHPSTEEALMNFKGPSYVSPHFEYQPWIELAELLKEITPGELSTSFRATGGTEAVEIALQAAICHTNRNIIIGIDDAYHGNSIATRAIVRNEKTFSWRKLKLPLNEKKLEELEDLLKDKKVAGLIMEPVILNKGVHVPEKEFIDGMVKLCKKYGTLIIMDEVATGFGRTGKLFASEHFSLSPDILCMAKALSGGAAAIGATIMTEEVGKSLREKDFPYSTFGWHPLSVAISLANIRFMKDNWTGLSENIRSLNEYFCQRLFQMPFKEKLKIRSMGLAIHLEFESKDYSEEINKKALEKGLILSAGPALFPPLNLEFSDAKEGLNILESSL
jgi:acetylornithine/succinyldiaminopimelate/putrescine aminotransferase